MRGGATQMDGLWEAFPTGTLEASLPAGETPAATRTRATASRYFFGSSNSQYRVSTPQLNAASNCVRLRTSAMSFVHDPGLLALLRTGMSALRPASTAEIPSAIVQRSGLALCVSNSA